MEDLKINKQPYLDLKDNEFKSFGQVVGEKGTGNPTYDAQKDLISNVVTKTTAFNAALSNAEDLGGTDRTKAKNNARKDLTDALGELVGSLEESAKTVANPEEFLTYLGFTIAKKPGSRKTAKIKAPIIKSVVSGGKGWQRGKVKIVFQSDVPQEIKAIIGKYSVDGGQTWVNGLISTKMIAEFFDQPSGKDCLYMFQFLGTNNRESEWTAPMSISVF